MVTNLKTIRSLKGISQKQLAQTLGVSKATMSIIENGYHPSIKIQSQLEEIFGKPFKTLIKEIDLT